MSDEPEDLISKLHSETARLSWSELQRHFARGAVVKVEAGMDLIKVAASIAEDDAEQVKQWMDQGLVTNASDDDARLWSETEADFWAVVASPLVIVQEITRKLDS